MLYFLQYLMGVELCLVVIVLYINHYHPNKDNTCNNAIDMFIALVLFYIGYCTISYGQLLYTHSFPVPIELQTTTTGLLKCAIDEYPVFSEQFYKIDRCIQNVTLYNVKIGRLPLGTSPETIAFVLPSLFTGHIFLVDGFLVKNIIKQALILVHECSHLSLSTVDHAYRWQHEFKWLTYNKHIQNADSYVDILVNACLPDNETYIYM